MFFKKDIKETLFEKEILKEKYIKSYNKLKEIVNQLKNYFYANGDGIPQKYLQTETFKFIESYVVK